MNVRNERGYTSKYLTHFVGRGREPGDQFDLLCKVIGDGCLLPGGKAKHADGNVAVRWDVAFSSNDLFWAEMICFCDIPLNQEMLRIHTQKYSQFGLAFDKEWAARRGASPVLYLALGSGCTDHRFPQGHPARDTNRKDFFDLAVGDWLNDFAAEGRPSIHRTRGDNLMFWYLLCYCKFFDETLQEEDVENYYMEREWRTIGAVRFSQEEIGCVVVPEAYQKEFTVRFPDLGERVLRLEAVHAIPPPDVG